MSIGTIWEWIKSFFSNLLSNFKEFIAAAFSDSAKLIIAELKDFAIETVTSLSLEDITNAEKREAAIARIKEEALARGIELGDSLASTIVELAYQYFLNNVADEIEEEPVPSPSASPAPEDVG